jgi:hypothetical protein
MYLNVYYFQEVMRFHGTSLKNNFIYAYKKIVGRDVSVVTETRYAVDGPEIESRWERSLSHPFLVTTHYLVIWVEPLSLQGLKRLCMALGTHLT